MHESRVLNANIEFVLYAFKQFNDMKRLNDILFKAKKYCIVVLNRLIASYVRKSCLKGKNRIRLT